MRLSLFLSPLSLLVTRTTTQGICWWFGSVVLDFFFAFYLFGFHCAFPNCLSFLFLYPLSLSPFSVSFSFFFFLTFFLFLHRYQFGADNESCFVLLQPEYSFAWRNIECDNTVPTNWDDPSADCIRDKIRLVLFFVFCHFFLSWECIFAYFIFTCSQSTVWLHCMSHYQTDSCPLSLPLSSISLSLSLFLLSPLPSLFSFQS